MAINTNIILATSGFSGFGNYKSVSFSVGIPSQGLGVNSYIGPYTASAALNNSNAVTEVQLQYTGLDSFWREVPGYIAIIVPNAGAATYEVQSFTYFKNGSVYVDTYISNQSGSTVTIPAITVNCRAFLFIAPF